jgi:hypothetical protein
MIIVAMVGSGALVILALAHWVRPPMSPQRRIERLAAECDEITETGEEFVGELDQCWTSLAHERAKLR